MKLCYQDFVYLYHGRQDLSDLKYHIRSMITEDQVILKWCDKDNETITIKRNDDLQFILKNEPGIARIKIQQSNQDKSQQFRPALLNKNFSFAPQFTLGKPQQNQEQHYVHALKKSESIEMPIDYVCEKIVEEQIDKIYPGFSKYIQQPNFNVNNPMDDELTRLEEIKPVMIKSQNLQFRMRESIAQKRINRESYQSQLVSLSSPQKMLGVDSIQNVTNLYCDNCSNKIEEKEGFYSCRICSDFDICKECQETNSEYNLHEHQLEFTDQILEWPKTEIIQC